MARLRDRATRPDEFRRQLHRASLVLAQEASRLLPTIGIEVTTPLGLAQCFRLHGVTAIIPIMRAGSGMLPAFETYLPDSIVWHVNVSRDHTTHDPIFRGSTVPDSVDADNVCFVLDPMLATGGTASHTISHLKQAGAKHIVFVGLLGCSTGIGRLEKDHPDVPIFLAAVDPALDANAYIRPGLGDAGDRCFPTVLD